MCGHISYNMIIRRWFPAVSVILNETIYDRNHPIANGIVYTSTWFSQVRETSSGARYERHNNKTPKVDSFYGLLRKVKKEDITYDNKFSPHPPNSTTFEIYQLSLKDSRCSQPVAVTQPELMPAEPFRRDLNEQVGFRMVRSPHVESWLRNWMISLRRKSQK